MTPTKMKAPGLLFAWLCLLLARDCLHLSVVHAGAPEKNSDRPDWSGVYGIVGDLTGNDDDLVGLKHLDPSIVKADALEALDGIVTAHLQPWAVAKMNATDAAADDTGSICQLNGIFRYPTTVAGFMWLQTPTKIIVVSTELDEVGVRRIYLTDKHPPDLAPSWNGHSIAHWTGTTLVVDTIGFNDKSWLQTSMQPHTEELHVIERIRAVGDGSLLEIQTTVDDREALVAPYSYVRHYKKINVEYQSVESHCNSGPEDQQMWNYMRRQALKKYANRLPHE